MNATAEVLIEEDLLLAPPAPADDDEALVARWQAGDEGAFDALVLRYHRRLFGFLIRLTATRQDAEEAYSETLIKVFRGVDAYEHRQSFRAWMFQVARRCAIDLQRKEGRWLRLLKRSRDLEIPPRPPGPDAALRRSQRAGSVDEALALLPEEHRAAVLLRYRHDLDHAELAAALGLSERQVRDRLSYARRVLRDVLPEESLHD